MRTRGSLARYAGVVSIVTLVLAAAIGVLAVVDSFRGDAAAG